MGSPFAQVEGQRHDLATIFGDNPHNDLLQRGWNLRQNMNRPGTQWWAQIRVSQSGTGHITVGPGQLLIKPQGVKQRFRAERIEPSGFLPLQPLRMNRQEARINSVTRSADMKRPPVGQALPGLNAAMQIIPVAPMRQCAQRKSREESTHQTEQNRPQHSGTPRGVMACYQSKYIVRLLYQPSSMLRTYAMRIASIMLPRTAVRSK